MAHLIKFTIHFKKHIVNFYRIVKNKNLLNNYYLVFLQYTTDNYQDSASETFKNSTMTEPLRKILLVKRMLYFQEQKKI